MKPPRRLESIYPPETLHTVFTAFDDAWDEIAHHFNGDAEDARSQLAHAVLLVAREDSDADRVKNDALQVMGLAYRDRLRPGTFKARSHSIPRGFSHE
jgi:hypothetical protein